MATFSSVLPPRRSHTSSPGSHIPTHGTSEKLSAAVKACFLLLTAQVILLGSLSRFFHLLPGESILALIERPRLWPAMGNEVGHGNPSRVLRPGFGKGKRAFSHPSPTSFLPLPPPTRFPACRVGKETQFLVEAAPVFRAVTLRLETTVVRTKAGEPAAGAGVPSERGRQGLRESESRPLRMAEKGQKKGPMSPGILRMGCLLCISLQT